MSTKHTKEVNHFEVWLKGKLSYYKTCQDPKTNRKIKVHGIKKKLKTLKTSYLTKTFLYNIKERSYHEEKLINYIITLSIKDASKDAMLLFQSKIFPWRGCGWRYGWNICIEKTLT